MSKIQFQLKCIDLRDPISFHKAWDNQHYGKEHEMIASLTQWTTFTTSMICMEVDDTVAVIKTNPLEFAFNGKSLIFVMGESAGKFQVTAIPMLKYSEFAGSVVNKRFMIVLSMNDDSANKLFSYLKKSGALVSTDVFPMKDWDDDNAFDEVGGNSDTQCEDEYNERGEYDTNS